MRLQIDKLGKVSVTIEESYWDINKDYDKLTVVEKEGTFGTYISRKVVPAGTMLTDRTYWIPFSSLKEDIVLDYNAFTSKYGDELSLIKDHISEIDKQLDILNKLNENTNEAISTANKAIEAATTAINAAKNALNEAENIIDTNKRYTEKLDKIGTNVTIGSNSNIGNNNYIGNYNSIGNNNTIDSNVVIQNNVVMKENVSVVANTTIASKTYINTDGLEVNDNHIIGRKSDGSVYIGSDSTGCNVIFNKDEEYPINIQDNKDINTILKIHKNSVVVLGTQSKHNTSSNINVFIGNGVAIDSDIHISGGSGTALTLSTNTDSRSVLLGENSILGTNVKLYKSAKSLQYQGDKLYTVATIDDVDKRVNDIVAGAPEALDTLKEIADKLEDNDDVVAGIVKTLATKADKTDLSDVTAEIAADYGDKAILLFKDGIEKHPITDTECIINSDGTSTFDGIAHIGYNTNIGNKVKIYPDVSISENTYIGGCLTVADSGSLSIVNKDNLTTLLIGTNISVDDNVAIGSNVYINGGVRLGSSIKINNVYVSDEDKTPIGIKIQNNKVKIQYVVDNGLVVNDVDVSTDVISIGSDTMIGNGVSIGNNVVISNLNENNNSVNGLNINNTGVLFSASIDTGIYLQDITSSEPVFLNIIDSGLFFENSKIAGIDREVGIVFRNSAQKIAYDTNYGLTITDNIIGTVISIGTGTNIGHNVTIESGIAFTIENGNLIVTVNNTKYGVVLNTIS